jgi:hypothetical protein
VIPGLRDSLTHRTAAELYRRHRDVGSGRCATCGDLAPCRSRRHAACVLTAAGDDPRSYDGRSAAAVAEGVARQAQTGAPAGPAHTGYHVGGRGRRASPDGYFYDRDSR